MEDKHHNQLVLPIKEKAKGLLIICNYCKGEPTDGICKNKDSKGNPVLGKCKHPEFHNYKVRIHKSGTKNGKRCKVLKTRSLSKAVMEAIYFRNQLDTPAVNPVVQYNARAIQAQEISLASRIENFLNEISPSDKLNNVRKVTLDRVKDIERCFEFFADTMSDMGTNIDGILPEGITHDHAVAIVQALQREKPGAYTQRRFIIAYTRFFNYLRKTYNWNHPNPFAGDWGLQLPEPNKEILSLDEFRMLLSAVDTAPKSEKNKLGRTILYWHTFIKDAFLLALLTGCRRGELISMKYSAIKFNSTKKLWYIEVKDEKGTKLSGREKKRVIIINQDIYDLFKEEKHIKSLGMDKYIIDNQDCPLKRGFVADLLSRAFIYYAEKAGIKKEVTFHSLRKTYLTAVASKNGIQAASEDIGHDSPRTTVHHYINEFEYLANTTNTDRFFGEKV